MLSTPYVAGAGTVQHIGHTFSPLLLQATQGGQFPYYHLPFIVEESGVRKPAVHLRSSGQ